MSSTRLDAPTAGPQFADLARPILTAVSRAAGPAYREVNGHELVAELEAAGHNADPAAIFNLMFHLREAGFVSFQAALGSGPGALFNITLARRGREQIEAWPKDSTLSGADVEAFFAILDARANDSALPAAERRKWAKLRDDLHAVGVSAVGGLITAWLKSVGAA